MSKIELRLAVAARRGRLDAVRDLHDGGVDPAADNNRAVQWATAGGHLHVVRYLCELPADRGVDPADRNNQAIRLAVSGGHLDVVRYLCELPADRGVDPATDDNRAFGEAAERGDLGVIRYLCELPADRGVDPADRHVWAAIQRAAALGHLDVVRYLCDVPADRGTGEYIAFYCLVDFNHFPSVARYLYQVYFASDVPPSFGHRPQLRSWHTEGQRTSARSPLISLCAILCPGARACSTALGLSECRVDLECN